MKQTTQMADKTIEVAGRYRKRGAVALATFDTRLEALTFARETAANHIEPGSGDSLIAVTVTDKATGKTLSTFYPDPYEADTLDDDDDG